MVSEGEVSLRGLKPDAKVFDELVFDVNSAYFESCCGYEYAREFFADAYKLAIKEIGGEEYVLSAVMHADERNRALSDLHGKDVFHYHLHVTYIPVVDKDVYYRKNNPDVELAGKLKETVKQVSHSKKWPKFKDEEGKWVNSYSKLQDSFHDHMKEAGYEGFERGERGSTAQHLSTLEYKTQQEAQRAHSLSIKADKQQIRLDNLNKDCTIAKQEDIVITDIDAMAKKSLFGNKVELSPENWKSVSVLAKKGVKSHWLIDDLKEDKSKLINENSNLRNRLKSYEGSLSETIDYYQAKARAPQRLTEVVKDILRKPSERQEPEIKRNKDLSR